MCIRDSDDTVYFEQRKDTFIRYCKEHQISYEPYLKETEFSADAGYQMMMELIEAGTLPSAVFAASDPIAIGAMRALYQKDVYKRQMLLSLPRFFLLQE